MCVSEQYRGADRVGVKLQPICDIDVGFRFISFDEEVCNSISLLSHFFKEVPRVANPLDEGCIHPEADEFLSIDVWIERHLVVNLSPFTFFTDPPPNAIGALVHLPGPQHPIKRTAGL